MGAICHLETVKSLSLKRPAHGLPPTISLITKSLLCVLAAGAVDTLLKVRQEPEGAEEAIF